MVAFNTLYQLGTQIKTESTDHRLYTLAASNGHHHALLISNVTGRKQSIHFEGIDLAGARFHVIGDAGVLAWAPNAKLIENNQVVLIEW